MDCNMHKVGIIIYLSCHYKGWTRALSIPETSRQWTWDEWKPSPTLTQCSPFDWIILYSHPLHPILFICFLVMANLLGFLWMSPMLRLNSCFLPSIQHCYTKFEITSASTAELRTSAIYLIASFLFCTCAPPVARQALSSESGESVIPIFCKWVTLSRILFLIKSHLNLRTYIFPEFSSSGRTSWYIFSSWWMEFNWHFSTSFSPCAQNAMASLP